jgi:hypothetical protein
MAEMKEQGFTFGVREARFVKRFMQLNEMDFKREIEKISKMTSEQYESVSEKNTFMCHTFNNIRIKMWVDCLWDADENKWDTENPEPEIILDYVHRDLRGGVILFHRHKFNIDDTDNWIDALMNVYQICKCGEEIALRDGFCRSCYYLASKQEDVCCCCHENEGVWIEFNDCKHTIHKYCFMKITVVCKDKENGRKCPLCRTFVSHGAYEYI